MMGTLLIAIVAWGSTPASELRAALADLHQQPASLQATTRYVSLYNLPADRHEETAAVLSFVLNSASRSATIVRPAAVPGTSLLRWNLVDYAPQNEELKEFSQAYEALIAAEPYWHLRTQVIDPRNGKKIEVFTDGGWVGLDPAAQLRALTVSGGALTRADWLITQLGSTPHYYRFAGIPATEAEFFQLLGLDPEAIAKLRADEGANLVFSHITHKVRRVVRRQGPLGGAWQTYDVDRSTPERDPLRNPFDFVYDAGEHIAAKSNGLHLFALYDAQGKRQDTVPDVIAKDDSDPHGDGIVVPMISCVRCHVEDGLRPFENVQRRIPLRGATSPAVAERLAQFYGGAKLGRQLTRDQEDYAAAVRQAAEREPREVAASLGRIFKAYAYDLVTPEIAARELCLTGSLRSVLQNSDDPILLLLCEGVAVQRQQWESSFAQAAVLAWRP
jgi:hypothetical protein